MSTYDLKSMNFNIDDAKRAIDNPVYVKAAFQFIQTKHGHAFWTDYADGTLGESDNERARQALRDMIDQCERERRRQS